MTTEMVYAFYADYIIVWYIEQGLASISFADFNHYQENENILY